MIQLSFSLKPNTPLEILCVGCHADDIEIGCGGTLLSLTRQYSHCTIHWVVFSAQGVRAEEAQHGAGLFTQGAAIRGPMLKAFPDGFMPFVGAEVKRIFEELKNISPDVIFTHSRKDAHQDHRLIGELTWCTFRNHFILEYEIPKYDGDLGQPSVFVPLASDLSQRKVSYIMEAFPSQQAKHWFRTETFFALMRLRGIECNSASGFAEAFYCRKLSL